MQQREIRTFAIASVFAIAILVLVTACGPGKQATPTASAQSALATSPQSSAVAAQQSSVPLDWKPVDQAMGRPGAMQPGNVYRYTFPRSDLQVTLGGVALKPAFALGGHVEFLPMGANDVMVMGDLVLVSDEVDAVLSKLQQGGVDMMALHNHLLGEAPRVMYLHVGAQGDPVKIADAIHAALALSKTPPAAPANSAPPADVGLDTKQLDQTLGYAGKANGAVYQFSVPRAEKIMDGGMEVPSAMGVATAINFQGTSGGKAAITGDFVLIGSEVGPVSRALRDNGIEVTAVHSHSLTEAPRVFYLHFFANDDANKLAQGLRAALDKTNSAKPAK